MKFSTQELVTLAVFGTLWGAVEIGLGAVLHALNLPMSGVFLSALGMVVALSGRLFVPRRGSILFIGVIAMVLKLFSVGSIVLGPMVGILTEALLAETALLPFRRPSRFSFVLAGGLVGCWTLLQPFFTGLVLFGRSVFVVWADLLQEGSRLLSLDASKAVFWILGIWIGLHLMVGVLAGWVAWGTGHVLLKRSGVFGHEGSGNGG